MDKPKLHSLIYVHTDTTGIKLALVGKIGHKHLHIIQLFPDVRVKRVPLNNLRWSYALGKNKLPGRAYRRLGRKHGITKAAYQLVKGIA